MTTSRAYPTLDRSPKKNWVDQVGGLPSYIERIAKHLHYEKGKSIGHAIAIAVNVVKKMCATGDINFPGVQQVNAGSHAEACKAVAEWEAKKARARVSKRLGKQKISDKDYIEKVLGLSTKEISDEEFDELASELDEENADTDGDTEFEAVAEIAKVDQGKGMVFGWCSVMQKKNGETVVDKQGDFIETIDDMEDAAYDFVLHSRDGGEMHIRKGVSTLVESFVSTPEKWKAMGIPEGTLPVGWWVGFKVGDQEVLAKAKNGTYRQFSVHGRGIRKVVEE